MPVNTDLEALALDLERVARELDRVRTLRAADIHGRNAIDIGDIFADLHAFAHRVGPAVVPALPCWQTPEQRARDARALARRLGGLPELLASAGPRRPPRLRLILGGAEPKVPARGRK